MKLSLKSLSKKGIRLILGILMMVCFIDLSMTLYFLISVSMRLGTLWLAGVVFFSFSYLYMPCVMLIIVCYLLLTRVWKYDDKH
jgi:hypothetical protein